MSPNYQARKRYTGWPSRGKRFGEAEKPGPTTYYPPATLSGNRTMEFHGHGNGHCIIRYGGKESAGGIHRVFCPDTGTLAYLDTGGLRNTWVWDSEQNSFYSI
eukprot:3030013-Heterocapsa_arctica.AAC.1